MIEKIRYTTTELEDLLGITSDTQNISERKETNE